MFSTAFLFISSYNSPSKTVVRNFFKMPYIQQQLSLLSFTFLLSTPLLCEQNPITDTQLRLLTNKSLKIQTLIKK